jgi:hypothetical protein
VLRTGNKESFLGGKFRTRCSVQIPSNPCRSQRIGPRHVAVLHHDEDNNDDLALNGDTRRVRSGVRRSRSQITSTIKCTQPLTMSMANVTSEHRMNLHAFLHFSSRHASLFQLRAKKTVANVTDTRLHVTLGIQLRVDVAHHETAPLRPGQCSALDATLARQDAVERHALDTPIPALKSAAAR